MQTYLVPNTVVSGGVSGNHTDFAVTITGPKNLVIAELNNKTEHTFSFTTELKGTY